MLLVYNESTSKSGTISFYVVNSPEFKNTKYMPNVFGTGCCRLQARILEPSQLGPLSNTILKLCAYPSAEEKNAWSFHCHAFHVTSRCDACAHRGI
jgi:hypothetical protein